MKYTLGLLFLLFTITSFASSDCNDSNLRNIKGVSYYNQLQYLKRFTKIAEFDSTAPSGFQQFFGEGETLCRDVTATYLTHKNGTLYILYTTNEDYCDGGNTIGVMINMTKYSSEDISLESSLVATISDSEFYCE